MRKALQFSCKWMGKGVENLQNLALKKFGHIHIRLVMSCFSEPAMKLQSWCKRSACPLRPVSRHNGGTGGRINDSAPAFPTSSSRKRNCGPCGALSRVWFPCGVPWAVLEQKKLKQMASSLEHHSCPEFPLELLVAFNGCLLHIYTTLHSQYNYHKWSDFPFGAAVSLVRGSRRYNTSCLHWRTKNGTKCPPTSHYRT